MKIYGESGVWKSMITVYNPGRVCVFRGSVRGSQCAADLYSDGGVAERGRAEDRPAGLYYRRRRDADHSRGGRRRQPAVSHTHTHLHTRLHTRLHTHTHA